ncbi:hypothetical protein [Stenotrophomonas oahuensis]|uniref:Uncharacterized protein n=1 Tax=Stenotrophomonas oahuensis TaxID=3003271 RepID=A0ABY9YSE2_9GAMM|nr:hypothetical protein [Stenotrophomonas sp. A5586]WNH53859.1 hypothetical protein PDM29_06150 [Stenotrophomonas sp. A5586]
MSNEYRYLWDGSAQGWALLHTNLQDRDQEPQYLIFNQATKMALLISNSSDYAAAKQSMLDHGVKVITDVA